MIRRRLYLASIAALLMAVAQPQTPKPSPVSSAEVKIANFAFAPATLTVAVGTPVTWTNHDDEPHTVVGDDKRIKSKALDTGEKFTFTFDKPGSYPYFCSVHPQMKGTVVVQ